MLDRIKMVKRKMDEYLEQLCEVSWMFSQNPGKDFTRNRKIPFSKIVSFLLAMEGGTLTTELLKRFGCSPDAASASAFVQHRSKLAPETFPALFDLFVSKTQPTKLYKGFRLFAADGSDIQIPNNPGHISSHYPGTNGQAPYNILHLDAIYDLLQCTYQDASLVGDRDANEQASLCCMVDRSPVENALIMMDRGYEGYIYCVGRGGGPFLGMATPSRSQSSLMSRSISRCRRMRSSSRHSASTRNTVPAPDSSTTSQ